jgi:hypothetical protein
MPRFSRISWKSREDADDRRGEAPAVGARDAGRADADVVLLGVLLREDETGRRRLHERSAHARPAGGRPLLALRALQHPHELVVLEIARGRDHDVAACIHLPVVRREHSLRHVRDHVGGADHGPSECMPPEHGLGEEVVHELLRRVLVHRDLLEDDVTLGIEVGERGREDHVGHHVQCRLDVSVGHARIHHRVLARRGRVQLAAEPVEDLGDLLRGVGTRALEEQVLDEVGDTRLGVGLVAGARADPEAERHRADAGDALGDDALA